MHNLNNLDKSPVCNPDNIKTPDYVHASYCVEVGPEIKLSDVISPKFWRHTKSFKVHDTIEVISEAFDALLRVTIAGDNLVVVRCIYAWQAGAAKAEVIGKPGARIEYLPAGKKKGYRVLDQDGQEISHGHATRAEAEMALRGAA